MAEPEQAQPERVILDEVRSAAQALEALVPSSSALGPAIVNTIQEAAREADRRLAQTELTLALVGEQPAWRATLLALVGEELLAVDSNTLRTRSTTVRWSPSFDYVARFSDGRTVQFSRSMPDRAPLFEKSLALVRSDKAAAETAREEIQASLESARARAVDAEAEVAKLLQELRKVAQDSEQAAIAHQTAAQGLVVAEPSRETKLASFLRAAPPWWAMWLWLARWILWPLYAKRVQAFLADTAASERARARVASAIQKAEEVERARAELEAHHAKEMKRLQDEEAAIVALQDELAKGRDLEQIRARMDRLEEERAKYSLERRAEFLTDLREYDEDPKGDDLVELVVDYPAKRLPSGVSIVDGNLPTPCEADGFVLVSDGEVSAATDAAAAHLRKSMPQVLTLETKGRRLVGSLDAFDAVCRDRGAIIGARAAMRLRACIAEVTAVCTTAEAAHKGRLQALEKQRLPEPAAFRALQLARAETAITQAAVDIHKSTVEFATAGFETIRKEQKDLISSAPDRRAVHARVKQLADSTRVHAMLDSVSEHVAQELQSIGESLERWSLEELQARYHTVHRMRTESLAPVTSDLTGDELEAMLALQPMQTALDSFEGSRVRYGLAGAAAGAAVGTLILPGIGTAAGAFVGVFAGFLKGLGSLKSECVAKIDRNIDEAKGRVLAVLDGKRPDLARILHVSLDDALGEALARFDRSIAHLLDIEKTAIAKEQTKLDALVEALAELQEHDARLAKCLEESLGDPVAS
jgi:hypothetical protein